MAEKYDALRSTLARSCSGFSQAMMHGPAQMIAAARPTSHLEAILTVSGNRQNGKGIKNR
jgi:hypothetical protein